MLDKHVLTEKNVLVVLRLCKQTLFPNGYPGPPRIIPSMDEQAALKAELVSEIEERLPGELRAA